jgi:hypothetical protein
VFFDPRAAKNALEYIIPNAASSTPQGHQLPFFPSSLWNIDSGVTGASAAYARAPLRLSARFIDSEELGEVCFIFEDSVDCFSADSCDNFLSIFEF